MHSNLSVGPFLAVLRPLFGLRARGLAALVALSAAAAMFAGCGPNARCVALRGVLDVGSGSSKMKVADVDHCRGVVLRTHARAARPLPYRDELARNANRFSDALVARGIETLRALKAESRVQPPRWVGVATQAFREAQNGAETVARLGRGAGAELRVISQAKEAELGYLPVLAAAGVPVAELVVWDVGGASTQITAQHEGRTRTIETAHGALAFKQLLLKLAGKTPTDSVNPVTPALLEPAFAAVRDAITASDQTLAEALRKRTKPTVVAIGAVWGKGILPMVSHGGVPELTRATLREVMEFAISKNDAELREAGFPPAFVDTAASNLVMAYAYMTTLGIERLRVMRADLTDGILLDPTLWGATQAPASAPPP